MFFSRVPCRSVDPCSQQYTHIVYHKKQKSIGKLCPNLAYVYGTMHTLSASGLCIVCSLEEKAMDIYKCTFPMTARTIYHRKRRHCSWSPFHPYNRPPSSYWTGSVIKHSSYVIVCCSRIHTSVTNRLPGNGSPTDWQVMAPVASSLAPQVTSMVHKHAPKVVANAYSVFQLCWLLSQTIRSPINIVNTWPDQPSP